MQKYIPLLPRNRNDFYASLPCLVGQSLIGLFMAVSGTIFATGGCAVSGTTNIDIPLSRWLSLFGTLYMGIMLLAVVMGVMMLSHVELETTPRKEVHDIHILDVLYLAISLPTYIFLFLFFLIGNMWYFSVDLYATFVGSNSLQCHQCLSTGYLCISVVWISVPACIFYVAVRKKMNLAQKENERNHKRKRKQRTNNNNNNNNDVDEEEDTTVGIGEEEPLL